MEEGELINEFADMEDPCSTAPRHLLAISRSMEVRTEVTGTVSSGRICTANEAGKGEEKGQRDGPMTGKEKEGVVEAEEGEGQSW